MPSPLQITFRSIPHSEALATDIRERASGLQAICDRIISCHVIVALDGHHHRGGDRFHISIHIGLPGHELLANRHAHVEAAPESAATAVTHAFDEAERQLEDWLGKRQAHRQDEARSSS
jgi:ribosome-associated translation inhibitor RaiA